VRPGRDDKVLVAWNGLAIEALATAGLAFERSDYLQAACRAADFILTVMVTSDGRLLHTWKAGQAKLNAYLDDHTALACGLITLYQATFEVRYLEAARSLMQQVIDHFGSQQPGYYFTADDHESLLTRNRDFTDNATPSGNAQAATALVKLAALLGRNDLLQAAEAVIAAAAELMQRIPHGMGQMLVAADMLVGPMEQYVLVGPQSQATARKLQTKFQPRRLYASQAAPQADDDSLLAPLLSGRKAVDGQTTLYVCQGQTCQQPVVGEADIASHG
jgi:uncharacterized protein YyaL (SSP411 family)